MIEMVTFGEGLRVDGPNWGAQALPRLQQDWKVLPPGIHKPNSHIPGLMVYATLTVLSDGRGRASLEMNPMLPLIASSMGEQVSSGDMNVLANALQVGNAPIDETNPLALLGNVRVKEVAPGIGFNCFRLMGIIRYNPDVYRRRVS